VFDPISGQGIFAALRSGMAAGSAVAAARDGNELKLDAYAAELEQAWTIYRRRCRGIYRSEHRWAAAPFWSMFGKDAA
jgi:flavin-dependent dehydrogenase